MISDLTLLKLFFNSREKFEDYESYIRREALSQEAKTILADLGLFYAEFATVSKVDTDSFSTWFNQIRHPEFNEVQHGLYNEVFKRVNQQEVDTSEEYVQSLIKHFKGEDYRARLQKHLETPNWSPEVAKEIIEKAQDTLSNPLDKEYEINDPESFCAATSRQDGLQWRLECLQNTLGSLIPGDFGIIAAPVNAGKSTFLISEGVNFAHQMKEGTLLWFTTEQTPKQVLKRLWCAALGITETELNNNRNMYKEQYITYMNGDLDRIKVFDGLGLSTADLARKIKKYDTKFVVVDMLDHITLKGGAGESDWRQLQRLYHAVRMMGRVAPILGSSQCDASTSGINSEGEEWYKHWITSKQLEGSKVGKQGAGDFIITIGIDPAYPKTRYINVCKSKTHKEIKSEVVFDAEKALFTNCVIF